MYGGALHTTVGEMVKNPVCLHIHLLMKRCQFHVLFMYVLLRMELFAILRLSRNIQLMYINVSLDVLHDSNTSVCLLVLYVYVCVNSAAS